MIERLEVLAGSGSVVRYGAVVAWADQAASLDLLRFLAQSARNLSTSKRAGRQMGDHIASVLAARDPEPHVGFAVIGPSDHGWATLLHGPVQLWDGLRWLVPATSPGWVQAIVTPQPAVVVAAAGSGGPTLVAASALNLEAGVVPGAGFVLVPASQGEMAHSEMAHSEMAQGEMSQGEMAEAPPAEVVGVPPTEMNPEPTLVFETAPMSASSPATTGEKTAAMAGGAPGDETTMLQEPIDLRPGRGSPVAPASPLPAGIYPDRAPAAGAAVVPGVRCSSGHLNKAGRPGCVRCGARLGGGDADATTVSGSRPPLGSLVTDDGSVYRLDVSYLVGSSPDDDPTVRGGLARALVLSGVEVAPSHAELRLDGWDVLVIDRGSASGTWVFDAGAGAWVRLEPYSPRPIGAGTHLAFGQRVLTFAGTWT